MALLDVIRGAVAPIAASLLTQLGDELTVYAPARVRQTDASTIAGWTAVGSLTAIRGPISAISSERAIRAWGAERNVVAEVQIAGVLASEIPASAWPSYGLRVTSGPQAGTSYLIVAARPDDVSDTVVLALQLSAKPIPS